MPTSSVKARAAEREPPPAIGIVCCALTRDQQVRHAVSEKYIIAAVEAVGGLPLLVPAAGNLIHADDVVHRLDGLLLPGSPSNIEPHHYDGAPSAPGTRHDGARDGMVLPLIRAAMRADVPLFAICRGIQELNVALGGSLHQVLREVPGRLDHMAPPAELETRYAHTAHPVTFTPGGLLAQLAGRESIVVNSLHQQGIDRLAPGLVVEATAPDGQIEAVRHPQARFVVGVQWHPEYRHAEVPLSQALFAAFGEACRVRVRRRRVA